MGTCCNGYFDNGMPDLTFGESCDELICPNCGGEDIHHDMVTVHSRAEEDKEGITVVVEDNAICTQGSMPATGVALGRRNDVMIRFWCEHCRARSILVLIQHKGKTYLEWYGYDTPRPAVEGEDEL